MPIYEYQCSDCQTIFEEWQSGYEEKEADCPQCGARSKRLISHSSFHLKGGGWFADGYGGQHSGSQPGEAVKPAEAPASNCPAKAGAGGADAAPAKKASDTSSAGSAS